MRAYITCFACLLAGLTSGCRSVQSDPADTSTPLDYVVDLTDRGGRLWLSVRDAALPYIVRVDAARGWIWIATAGADALLRFFPDGERFAVHPYPTPNSFVRHLNLDP